MGEPVVPHHFSAKCLPRFAIAFPIGVFICTDEPSIQKHHRAQEHSTVPSIHSTMHLSFPILPTALIAPQSKNRHQEKIKKKKVKVCCQENAPTISSRKRFFRKSFVALKVSPKIFLKKYCIAFSFHTVGALSFFLFFLLKNFQRSKIF